MKIIQELQSPDIEALKPRVIAAEIEEIASGARRFRQLLRENRDLVNKPGDYVDFTYRYGGALFQKVATKLTEVSWSTIGYSSVRITVEKWGAKLKFAREDLETANRDVLAESLYEAGLDYAEQVDLECKLALYKAVESTAANIVTDGYIAQLPAGTKLLEVLEVSGEATGFSSADYYKGKVEVSGAAKATSNVVTIRYYHSELPDSQFLDAYKTGEFAFRDLQAVRNAVAGQNYNAQFIVMHPEAIAHLLLDTQARFLDASAYGARTPILQGEIGQAGGLRILNTTREWKHASIAVDPDHAGRFVIKKELESIRKELPEAYGLEYDLWAFFKPGLIREGAVAVVVNVGGTAKSW